VNATRIFARASPQNYSLVVLGKFTGVLQSPYNPVGAANATTGTCVVNAPVIDTKLSVPSLTNRKDVQVGGRAGQGWTAGVCCVPDHCAGRSSNHHRLLLPSPQQPRHRRAGNVQRTCHTCCRSHHSRLPLTLLPTQIFFSSPISVASSVGYQCKLTDTDGKTGSKPSLHDWRACTSPAAYTGLLDAAYSFLVRAKGEDFASTMSFTVDSTPPQTTLTTSLPAAANSATVVSASDNVTFTFSAVDTSTVSFTCRLSPGDGAPQGGDKPAYLRLGSGPLEFDKNFGCSSPVTVLGLSFGDWKFMVGGPAPGAGAGALGLMHWEWLSLWLALRVRVGVQLAAAGAAWAAWRCLYSAYGVVSTVHMCERWCTCELPCTTCTCHMSWRTVEVVAR
jgi:hypothetical protein